MVGPPDCKGVRMAIAVLGACDACVMSTRGRASGVGGARPTPPPPATPIGHSGRHPRFDSGRPPPPPPSIPSQTPRITRRPPCPLPRVRVSWAARRGTRARRPTAQSRVCLAHATPAHGPRTARHCRPQWERGVAMWWAGAAVAWRWGGGGGGGGGGDPHRAAEPRPVQLGAARRTHTPTTWTRACAPPPTCGAPRRGRSPLCAQRGRPPSKTALPSPPPSSPPPTPSPILPLSITLAVVSLFLLYKPTPPRR